MPSKPTDTTPADDAPRVPVLDLDAAVQRIGEIAAIWATAIGPVVESIVQFSRRLFASMPRHDRKRYMPPTAWHYKRARVELRRAGKPVTGKAVAELAAAIRRGGDDDRQA